MKLLSASMAIWSVILPLSAQDNGAPEVTTARILGDLPDGTSPTPEPEKPAFIVAAKDILETETLQQGGREITIQEIKPIELPPPPQVELPLAPTNPTILARIAKLRKNRPHDEVIHIGASVFRDKNSAPRTLVDYRPDAQGEPIAFWSSADFSILAGLSSFVGSDGKTRSLMMTWSTTQIDHLTQTLAKHGREYEAPEIPTFLAGKATFIIATGTPTAENLASIQSLHDVCNNDYEKLKAAAESREQARLQQEAELKARPPQPKDITLSHWRIDPAGQTATEKGIAR